MTHRRCKGAVCTTGRYARKKKLIQEKIQADIEEENDYVGIHTASCALWAEKLFFFSLLLGINNTDVRDRTDWNVVQPGVILSTQKSESSV